MRTYLGGAGLGAKILWDEVPADVGWDHPENRLVLGTGPLAGLPVWGTGGLTVVTRGAMTNGGTSTQANGFFGANLKYSGYDAIVVQGQAPEWIYLLIHGDRVELRDARHLLGKDTWETQDALYAELGLLRPHAERLLDRAGRREPGPLRRDPGRLRPRRVQERRRRRHGEEAPEGGGDRARRPRAPGGGPAGAHRGRRRHRPRPPDEPRGQDALRVRDAAGRREPPRARRPADQELHDERHSARRRHEAVGGPGAPERLRPPRPPVQRLRDAPLPHAGAAERQAQGPDRRRARVRGLVGRRLDHRAAPTRWPSPGSTRRSTAPAST